MVRAFLVGESVLDPAKSTMAPCGSGRLRELVPGSDALGCIGLGLPRAPSSCLIGVIDVVAIRPLDHALSVPRFGVASYRGIGIGGGKDVISAKLQYAFSLGCIAFRHITRHFTHYPLVTLDNMALLWRRFTRWAGPRLLSVALGPSQGPGVRLVRVRVRASVRVTVGLG